MTSTFKTTGFLHATSFVELAGAINRQRLTGSLHLNNGQKERQAERIIYFSRGEVYAAASNLAPDSALAILIRAGRATQELANRIQSEVLAGRAFSEALVSYGCVTRDELNHLRIEHVKYIFNSLCEWTSGSYSFTESHQVSGGYLGVSTKALIVEGALLTNVPQWFSEKVFDPCTWISADQPATSDLSLQPFAYFLLSCLNQPRNLVILTDSGRMDESDRDLLQQLFGIYCAGLMELTLALNPADNPLLTSTTTRQTLASKQKVTLPPQPEEAIPCTALARPLKEDPETAKRRRLQDIKNDIKRMRQLLSSADDDYAVLELKAGVTSAEVKSAYRKMVNHFHPDRHHPYADPITLATLSDVLMAIRASYETAIEHALLSEIISANTQRYRTARKVPAQPDAVIFSPSTSYTAPRQAQSDTMSAQELADHNSSLAEVKHRRALAYQSQGEYELAINLMTEAVTLMPDCARYHGDLAALLEKVPMRRDQAEQHFLRATELEPGNLFYHLQLGSFYRAVGLLARAEQQFVLALKIDPIDRAAASALEEVMSLKKSQRSNSQYGRSRPARQQSFWTRIFNRNRG